MPGSSSELREPIAVVGLGGIFPGGPDLEAFWQLVRERRCAARDVPQGRWLLPPDAVHDPRRGQTDKVLSRRGCFIEDFRLDPAGLALEPQLLARLDPVCQLLLHAGRQAWQGVAAGPLDLKRVGVVIGNIALPTDGSAALARQILGPTLDRETRHPQLTHPLNRWVAGMPAGLLARALGLGGGTYALDAACASTLFAVALAADELRAGRADAMLTGGVSRPDCLYTQMGFTQLGALSQRGESRPFDAKGDGLVVGEGAGILVLKRLSDALAHGDHIHGLITGAGLSNDLDGSLLAPSSEGQLRAMRLAYAQAGWKPSDVDLVECHATGTPLGDAVEFASLSELWGREGWSQGQCVLGSVKSNVGHLLTAAGAAGLCKVLFAMRDGVLPPTAAFESPAKEIDLASSPFTVLTSARPWERRAGQVPRRAALSGFGFGGINAHLLVEEWTGEGPQAELAARARRTPANLGSNDLGAGGAPIAVIGLAARAGSAGSLAELQHQVLAATGPDAQAPDAERWWDLPEAVRAARPGFYMQDLSVPAGAFRIPPRELADMLPQQALMLMVARDALADVVPSSVDGPRTGAFVGLGLDLNTTNFHLRWTQLPDADADSAGPPLTPNRTIGSLGSIVASRLAREFRLGGPTFAVSCEDASGMRALELGVRALQRGELDAAVVGAVDLAGDARAVLATHLIRPYGSGPRPRPFEPEADGTLPGEGAVALVLKRLDDAVRDGDRVLAVIDGMGAASGGGVDRAAADPAAYVAAVERALTDARVPAAELTYVETHGSGTPQEDVSEATALSEALGRAPDAQPCALGSLKADVGHTGAVSGLLGLAKATLCLYHEILPPFRSPVRTVFPSDTRFHFPRIAQGWIRDRVEGPRRAGVASMSGDGNCMFAVLSGAPAAHGPAALRADMERVQPLGPAPEALFVVVSKSPPGLLKALAKLREVACAPGPEGIEHRARTWYRKSAGVEGGLAVSLVARTPEELDEQARLMERLLRDGADRMLPGAGRIYFSSRPLGPDAQIAFVFPGSGNQYPGMGLGIGARWPDVLRRLDSENLHLRSQMLPESVAPWRLEWPAGWEAEAERSLDSDPWTVIFGQVTHATIITDLVTRFGVRPQAVIGYSLGETASMLAMRAWRDRDEMLRRMRASTLFTRDLAGPCDAARHYWGLAPGEPVEWRMGLVDRPASAVRALLADHPRAYLQIVNAPEECVVGGDRRAVDALVADLGCQFTPLEGVPTVHAPVVESVADAYRAMHLVETTPPAGVRYYSCAWNESYVLSRETAADSILQQAITGLDWPATIEAAYADGVRVFLEMGPRASCSRMIGRILGTRPHMARSACYRGQDELSTILRLLAHLSSERVPVDLDPLYGRESLVFPEPVQTAAPTVTIALSPPRTRPVRRAPEPDVQPAEPPVAPIPVEPAEAVAPVVATADPVAETAHAAPAYAAPAYAPAGPAAPAYATPGYAEPAYTPAASSPASAAPVEAAGSPSAPVLVAASPFSVEFPSAAPEVALVPRPLVVPAPAQMHVKPLHGGNGNGAHGRNGDHAPTFQPPPAPPLALPPRPALAAGQPPRRAYTNSDAPASMGVDPLHESIRGVQNPGVVTHLRHASSPRHGILDPGVSVPSAPAGTGVLVHALMATAEETTRAHSAFLSFTYATSNAQARLFELKSTLLSSPVETQTRMHSSAPDALPVHDRTLTARGEAIPPVALTRQQCMEFAVGSIARVLGERFAEADTFPTRVRLPDEPLMLVDRILRIDGEPGSMTHGRVITEHDIYPGAWYLDGGCIPTCIAVEAGQADLFLSGYLGIDLETKGLACYRLLDAVVTFHRGLPGPGDVIHYDIEIERFARQGDTYIFFFNFEGTVNGQPLLSMRKGCAGFFTAEALAAGRGIVHTKLDLMVQPGKKPADWRDLVPMKRESYTDAQVERLRHSDLAGCYGPLFANLPLKDAIRLPSGRMKLVDRVTDLEPTGGRFGIGFIRAEADIRPDDWFLTCHFVDDQVMPGTLMYECCMHTMRILLMRMGWVGEQSLVGCEPVPGHASQLKCRGQVLASTKKVTYEITLKEVGYRPEPYAIGDALMYSDGHPIVEIRNMTCQYRGTDRAALEALWRAAGVEPSVSQSNVIVPQASVQPTIVQQANMQNPVARGATVVGTPTRRTDLVHDLPQILHYSIGKPSEAFGEPYRIFDTDRVLARLPGPPYLFMDRVLDVHDGQPFVLKAGAVAVAEYDVPQNAWYFEANRQPTMSFAVLLEAVLQPCGWLACYLGSALRGGSQDLRFRNLGGTATLFQETWPDSGTIQMVVKLTKTSESGGMIIQEYDLSVTCGGEVVYQGKTSFGFFSKKALAEQVGVRGAKLYELTEAEAARAVEPRRARVQGLELPDTTLKMFDRVEAFVPDGGAKGLGFIRGTKRVEPQEWFFKAHFYQDPVCPGSLGLESFLQLLKVVARDRWGQTDEALRFEPIALGVPHSWIYRGQIQQTNRVVTVEATITGIDDATRTLTADGYLAVDGMPIYQMTGFSMRVVPAGPGQGRGG